VTRRPTVDVNVADGNSWNDSRSDDGFGFLFQRRPLKPWITAGAAASTIVRLQQGWW